MVSQEQLEQAKQHMPGTEDDAVTPSTEEEYVEEASGSPTNGAGEASTSTTGNELAATTTVTKKKRVKKKQEPVDEKSVSTPRPSYWPLFLAFSLAVVLAGAISSLIVLGIGVLLVVVSMIGWGLERRS
jgi:cobalamin biosynthesis Mg chelatase CobN